ncbi:hypothetical protein ACLKA6_014247 [Drosophila palustris]
MNQQRVRWPRKTGREEKTGQTDTLIVPPARTQKDTLRRLLITLQAGSRNRGKLKDHQQAISDFHFPFEQFSLVSSPVSWD